LTGCGGDTYTQVIGSVPRDYRDRMHLVFWHSFGGGLGEALTKLVGEFNESQNDIYIELQFQGAYENSVQKLSASLVARQVPDLVILSEVTWRKMHLADRLEPLDDYFGGDFQPSVFVDNLIEEGTVKGSVLWVPFARSTPLFYYNKTVFEQAGLPAEGPRTWSDLKEWAPALQQHTNRTLALAGQYASWYFQSAAWAFGGQYSDQLDVTMTDERTVAAAQYIVDLIREDEAAYLAASTVVDFGNSVTACTMMSTGTLATATEAAADFELGTTFLLEQDHFGCPTGGAGIGIMRDAAPERKEAAAEFLKFTARPDKSAQWTVETGYMPAVKAAREDPVLVQKAADDPNYETALNQLPRTSPQDLIRPMVPAAGEMLDSAMERLYSSNASVEDVFGNLQVQLQRRADLIKPIYEERYL
jgi:sn-glycerol 3-phosphate transport system substrate-binding protein